MPADIPNSFSWDFKNWFHVDNLEQYIGVDVYAPEDAEKLVLQFQKFSDELNRLIREVNSGKDAEILMKLYNRLVTANNHVLGFVGSDDYKTWFHMNEMKLPSQLEIIRATFGNVMWINGDRNPTRWDLIKRLEAKIKSPA